jgi:hypothetical protein
MFHWIFEIEDEAMTLSGIFGHHIQCRGLISQKNGDFKFTTAKFEELAKPRNPQ